VYCRWDDGAILPADGLYKHMCTVGGDDALPADGLLRLTTVYVPVNGDDGAILPAEGLLRLLMCTLFVGGMMVQYSQPMDSSSNICVL